MVNNGELWLVGGWPIPLNNDGVSSSLGMMTFPISGKNKIHVPNHQPVDLMGYLMMIPSGNHTLDGKCPRNMEAWIIYPWWIFNCHIWAPSGSESLNKENEEYSFQNVFRYTSQLCTFGFAFWGLRWKKELHHLQTDALVIPIYINPLH